jgi:hypothetical protein
MRCCTRYHLEQRHSPNKLCSQRRRPGRRSVKLDIALAGTVEGLAILTVEYAEDVELVLIATLEMKLDEDSLVLA